MAWMKRLGGVCAAAAAAVLAISGATAQPSGPAPTITPAPAFTPEQLAAPPAADWPTNGGDLANQRFSPITSLNRGNVAGLKAVWRASLGGSGLEPGLSGGAQPLVYKDTAYIVTGENGVFAINLDSGKVVWSYRPTIDWASTRLCCGRNSRGLGMGDGMIFLSQLDARIVALDQKTGKVVWSLQAEDPKEGFSITSAPLYYNGLLITGFSGGDEGIRGRVKAYDARTGKLVWTFYTIPGPGEPGHETWPADNERWTHGGGPVWQTPAIDPKLGLIYFSTGNPGPDLNGSVRAGDNLYTDSIVALDVATGRYRWHFQEVHHDIWDYDAPNPVILFDAVVGGVPRQGLVEVGKTGWAYILDRVTGKPLVGINETAVMQNEQQKTSATQPYPVGDAVVPQSVDMPLEGVPLVNQGRIFTPFGPEGLNYKPGAAVNWPPSSYDPDQRLIYVCATDRVAAVKEGRKAPEPGGDYNGGAVILARSAKRGVFAAVDVTTNRLAWRQQWYDTCYSGSVATAGGLVFVGRNDGRLMALNSSTGEHLWSFQTDAGVNATASVFERNGKPYVIVLAAGNSFAIGRRGDGVWLFGLDGTINSLPEGSAELTASDKPPPPPHGDDDDGDAKAAPLAPPDLADGRKVFEGTCASCHGPHGEGGHMGGPPFKKGITEDFIVATASHGRNQMPAFGGVYSPQILHDVAAYIARDLAQ